jgi:hypothetical protein
MNEHLKHAFEVAQQLSNEAQYTIAVRILEEIEEIDAKDEEHEWNTIVSQPRVRQRLRELGRQALEEDRAGETEDGSFDCQ